MSDEERPQRVPVPVRYSELIGDKVAAFVTLDGYVWASDGPPRVIAGRIRVAPASNAATDVEAVLATVGETLAAPGHAIDAAVDDLLTLLEGRELPPAALKALRVAATALISVIVPSAGASLVHVLILCAGPGSSEDIAKQLSSRSGVADWTAAQFHLDAPVVNVLAETLDATPRRRVRQQVAGVAALNRARVAVPRQRVQPALPGQKASPLELPGSKVHGSGAARRGQPSTRDVEEPIRRRRGIPG
jgi:hypothetical protein